MHVFAGTHNTLSKCNSIYREVVLMTHLNISNIVAQMHLMSLSFSIPVTHNTGAFLIIYCRHTQIHISHTNTAVCGDPINSVN